MADDVRVLVASGSPAYRSAVCRALAAVGGVVVASEAGQGSQAIAQALRARPDLALLDVHLPGGNGLAVARALRRAAPWVRVVLLLSDDGPTYRVAASRVGAKWVAKERLVEGISQLFGPMGSSPEDGSIAEGGTTVGAAEHDFGMAGRRLVSWGSLLRRYWREDLVMAARPAVVIFLVGMVLLGLTAFLAWDVRSPVVVGPAGITYIEDELGLFGNPGALVALDGAQTKGYMAAEADRRHWNLLLCLGVGALGLAVGSVLIAWRETRERRWPPQHQHEE